MTVTFLQGDCRSVLASLPANSVHCVVTSPPYWGLRSYGTESQVWGGDPAHAHQWALAGSRHRGGPQGKTGDRITRDTSAQDAVADFQTGSLCSCGAWRGEHGQEPTLALWLDHEVQIFREVRRVLRKDGTLWLNCGDAYATHPNGRSARAVKEAGNDDRTFRDKPFSTAAQRGAGRSENLGNVGSDIGGAHRRPGATELASKQRLMLPARLAIALQEDGWWLRDEIVWHKPNPMPSSVKDRTCPAHEMLYMFSRSPRYYYDHEAIKEPRSSNTHARTKMPDGWDTGPGAHGTEKGKTTKQDGHGRRHAGFNERYFGRPGVTPKSAPEDSLVKAKGSFHATTTAVLDDRLKRSVWTINPEAFPEAHFATFPTALVEPCILAGCPAGGTVLDPFGGSGTIGLVADRHGRNAVMIELNVDYIAIAERRLARDRLARGEHSMANVGKAQLEPTPIETLIGQGRE